jgi:lipoprotein-anchoring transpeptidase ErfK/SrfK
MSKQHLWFYKNGSLIVQGDVVTGNVSENDATPAGIYRLKFKQTNAILRGPDYSAHVDYWMPFNGGIGIHDAGWRSEFGGNIYRTNGSHGCVNSPYYLAKTIFDNIEEGNPVICYY